MTSIFNLDPRVLDDCVSDSTPDIGIVATAAAYFKRGENGMPNYCFYVNAVDKKKVNKRLLELPQSEYDGHHGDLSLRFQRANLVFMPVSDGDRYQWGSRTKEFRESYLEACDVLYIRGEFLEGDAEKFKMLGVAVL